MDDELHHKEAKTLEVISNYMELRLYTWVNYKNFKIAIEAHVISEKVREFWNDCIHAFEVNVIELFCRSDVKLYKDNEPSSALESEVVKQKEKSPYEGTQVDDEGSGWLTPLAAFASAYDELIFSCGIEDPKLLNKMGKLFDKFCLKVDYYVERDKRKHQLNGSILGSDNLKHLPYLLNLQERKIFTLLPYLLTAYTFNSWNCRFLYKRQRLAQFICPTMGEKVENIDSSEASKISQGIKPFCRIFSLEDCKKGITYTFKNLMCPLLITI